ncbi:hypothetical protein AAFN85_24560 [Mucilaginibacter sp. CAU 1740]|uniref:hypothetical protein n=1 Tax=Mucilaginibacter sp. CAU 1740 TaxID=3140365 RepID=UPI00325AF9B2
MLAFNHASAQNTAKTEEEQWSKKDTKTYNIISIDGKNQKVTIIPDYGNHVLKITSLKETISISDYWGVPPETRLLNKNFIEIKYAVRGGSDLGLGNILIICVNNTHLYEAMHVLGYVNSETMGENAHYKVTLTSNAKNTSNKVNAHIHDDINSKRYPETNYVYDNNTVLAFDTAQNVFYSVKENLYDHFIKVKNKAKQKVAGMFPMLLLGKETYYFINDKWYTGDLDKEMFEFK